MGDWSQFFEKPEIDFSKVSKEELQDRFYGRYYDYYNILSKVMNGDQKERMAVVAERFEYILDCFVSQRKQIIDDFSFRGSGRMLQDIFKSEIGFLNFITESTDKRDHELSGIVIRDNEDKNDERKIFGAINKSITYNIIRVLAFEKEKKGEPFKIPEEVIKYSDRYFRFEDSAVNYLTDLMGNDIYKYYFNGKGREFENRLFGLYKDALMYLPECQEEVNEFYEELKGNNNKSTKNDALNILAASYLKNIETHLNTTGNYIVENNYDVFVDNCVKLKKAQMIKKEIERQREENIEPEYEEVTKAKKGLK
ncbi:MAG: hypothetical protein IIZ40_03960 [Bacilli bacterium]|nr:hypothetical protein [Bacilli bacterium]